jgi:SpoVK/Ycf46/Vps4 family AAA+-type ATPase
LPPELLRKGRFDEVFFVDLPTAEERAEILRMYFSRYLSYDLPPDLLDELITLTEGFSGSDIDATVNDIATSMFAQHSTELPQDSRIIQFFENVVPYSKTNPEDVNDIRNWGLHRAVPANATDARQPAATSEHARQVVLL